MQMSLPLMSGLEDFRAKVSRWLEWGREKGLKASALVSFTNLLGLLERVCPQLLSSKTLQVCEIVTADETSKPLFTHWPSSGMVWDGVCLTANISESPNHVKGSILLDVIEKGEVPQRYFLSPNAAVGMMRRADRMKRNLFPPLRQALEILAKASLSKDLHTVSTPAQPDTQAQTGAEPTDGRVRRLTPGECEGIQGFPTNWTLPTKIPDDVEKLDTMRYTSLGNAVTVPAIEWLARRIQPVLQRMNMPKVMKEETNLEVDLQTLRSGVLAS